MRKIFVAAIAIVFIILFVFFVPVIKFDTNVLPRCVWAKSTCPLAITVPITNHHVYWSISAYLGGPGSYLVPWMSYGLA